LTGDTRTISDAAGTYHESFTYDYLNQLSSEQGVFNHTYEHDAHKNRLAKDGTKYSVNLLNQLLSEGETSLTYDLNGNLLTYGSFTCRYDALDRLVAVTCDEASVSYSYDEMNRCIRRDQLRYFYISQSEVGSCNDRGEVEEFQMVGPGRSSAPCQALAIELKGEAYTTLHDQSGHLRALISHQDGQISTYRYSAFGEKRSFNPVACPWTFAGKREDPLTSWILFGRRFYLPSLGRFLTQDPAGLSASPNLYAYLANSPLVRYDTYGLFEVSPRLTSLANTAGKIAHGITHLISAPAFAVNEARKAFGFGLYHIGRNIVPLPYLQDIPQAVGYFLHKSTMEGYIPSFKESNFDIVYGSGDRKEGLAEAVGLGIGTTRESAENAQKHLQAMNGYCTDVIFGPTHGFSRDIGECILVKLGVYTPLVDGFTTYMREQTDAVGSDGVFKFDVHSRGGITCAAALKNLTAQQKSCIWLNTLGTGSIIDDKGLKYVMNHISTCEWVTGIGDPFSYGTALFKQQDHVQFHKSNAFLFEHRLLSPTYEKAFKDSADYFNKQFKK
jgi:RHS repeat-associated protein